MRTASTPDTDMAACFAAAEAAKKAKGTKETAMNTTETGGDAGGQKADAPRKNRAQKAKPMEGLVIFPNGARLTLGIVLTVLYWRVTHKLRRVDVTFRPADWKGKGKGIPEGKSILPIGFGEGVEGNLPLEHRVDGREVGPLVAAIDKFGSPVAKAVGAKLVEIAKRYGAGDPPESLPLAEAALLGPWFAIREDRPMEHWLLDLRSPFETWFWANFRALREEVFTKNAGQIVDRLRRESGELGGAGKGAICQGGSRDFLRAAAFDPKIGGFRFILDTSGRGEDATVSAVVIAPGRKAGYVNAAWQMILEESGEVAGWRVARGRGEPWVVFVPNDGHTTTVVARAALPKLIALMKGAEALAKRNAKN